MFSHVSSSIIRPDMEKWNKKINETNVWTNVFILWSDELPSATCMWLDKPAIEDLQSEFMFRNWDSLSYLKFFHILIGSTIFFMLGPVKYYARSTYGPQAYTKTDTHVRGRGQTSTSFKTSHINCCVFSTASRALIENIRGLAFRATLIALFSRYELVSLWKWQRNQEVHSYQLSSFGHLAKDG